MNRINLYHVFDISPHVHTYYRYHIPIPTHCKTSVRQSVRKASWVHCVRELGDLKKLLKKKEKNCSHAFLSDHTYLLIRYFIRTAAASIASGLLGPRKWSRYINRIPAAALPSRLSPPTPPLIRRHRKTVIKKK